MKYFIKLFPVFISLILGILFFSWITNPSFKKEEITILEYPVLEFEAGELIDNGDGTVTFIYQNKGIFPRGYYIPKEVR